MAEIQNEIVANGPDTTPIGWTVGRDDPAEICAPVMVTSVHWSTVGDDGVILLPTFNCTLRCQRRYPWDYQDRRLVSRIVTCTCPQRRLEENVAIISWSLGFIMRLGG